MTLAMRSSVNASNVTGVRNILRACDGTRNTRGEAGISQKSSRVLSPDNVPCHAVMDSQLGVFFDVHPPRRLKKKKTRTCEGDVSGRFSALVPCQPVAAAEASQ